MCHHVPICWCEGEERTSKWGGDTCTKAWDTGTSTFSSVAGVQQGAGRSEASGPLSEDLKTKLRSCPEGAGKKPGCMMSWKAFLCTML